MRAKVLAVALAAAISSRAATALPPISRLPTAAGAQPEVLIGHLDVTTDGQMVVLALSAEADGAVDRQFTIELSQSPAALLGSFHSDAARILSWPGHLLVIADREHRLFHFSVAGFEPPDPSSSEALLDRRVRPSQYTVTRITGALAIIANTPAGARALNGPLAFVPGGVAFLQDCCSVGDTTCCIDYQDYSSGGGGGCASSTCSVTCNNGTSCTAQCASSCASCSCKPSATCNCG
jgi:hypothetical protein